MRQLTGDEAGKYLWREAPDPVITAPGQALVRPLVVACCDLDVAVARGAAPLPPGYARAVIPDILELLAGGCDLSPIVERVVPWEDAPSAWPTMTGKTVFSRL